MSFLCCRICRFFRYLQYIFFAATSQCLKTFLALHSIKSSDSAHAAQFCSADSQPVSIAKVSHPVFPSKYLVLIGSLAEATYISILKIHLSKLFTYQSIRSCVLILALLRNFLRHFDSKEFPASSKCSVNCNLHSGPRFEGRCKH